MRVSYPFDAEGLLALHAFALKCLRESRSPYGYHFIAARPRDARIAEYHRMLDLTKFHRTYPIGTWLGWRGPWVEDVWISTFCCDRDIDDFGPFIPLFVPWVNIFRIHKFRRGSNNTYEDFIRPLFREIRADFVYITVNDNDYGMEGMEKLNRDVPWNILVLSSSGRGHVPILRHFRQQPPVAPLAKVNDIIFLGKMDRRVRERILNEFRRVFGDRLTVRRKVANWVDAYRQHSFVLAPRGNARGTFRATEILQMGLIPILAFRARKWVPYLNSSLPWGDIGFHTTLWQVARLRATIDGITEERLAFMRATIRRYRDSHFTVQGTMRQIGLFMRSGYDASDLRCDRYHANH